MQLRQRRYNGLEKELLQYWQVPQLQTKFQGHRIHAKRKAEGKRAFISKK